MSNPTVLRKGARRATVHLRKTGRNVRIPASCWNEMDRSVTIFICPDRSSFVNLLLTFATPCLQRQSGMDALAAAVSRHLAARALVEDAPCATLAKIAPVGKVKPLRRDKPVVRKLNLSDAAWAEAERVALLLGANSRAHFLMLLFSRITPLFETHSSIKEMAEIFATLN